MSSAALASASAAARAAMSSSFTTLRLLRSCVPKPVVVVCANDGSSAVSFGEGSGFGDRSSTSNGGGETERAREVTRRWCDIRAASAP